MTRDGIQIKSHEKQETLALLRSLKNLKVFNNSRRITTVKTNLPYTNLKTIIAIIITMRVRGKQIDFSNRRYTYYISKQYKYF